MAFTVTKLGVFVGFSIQDLSGDALEHEQKMAFKDAFVEDLKAEIPSYDEVAWGDFLVLPTDFWYNDATGSAAEADVTTFLIEVVQPPGVNGMAIGALTKQGCDNSPDGWERARTFTMTKNGMKMTLAGAVDRYSLKTPLPLDIKGQLSALDIYFTVRWTSRKV